MGRVKLFSRFSVFLYTFSALCVALLLISCKSARIASVINATLGNAIRRALALFSYPFPFSLFELVCLCAPFLLIAIIIYVAKKDSRRRFFLCLSLLCAVFATYILSFGIAYKAPSALSHYSAEVSETQTAELARELAERVNSFSGTPLSDTDAIGELNRAISSRRGMPPIKIKKIALSSLLTRMRILGFYSFLTGELNVNMFIPSYLYCFTAAHEYAHLLGYAREGEANLFAYILLHSTQNEYLSYCADLVALEYLLFDIYKRDKMEYNVIYSSLSDSVIFDLKEYGELISRYPELSFSKKVSDAHLSVWDTDGYSTFTRLLVCYHQSNNAPKTLIK